MANRPLTVRALSPEEHAELDKLYRHAQKARLRTRAQMTVGS